jgi:hypothetical protein
MTLVIVLLAFLAIPGFILYHDAKAARDKGSPLFWTLAAVVFLTLGAALTA